MRLRKYRHIKRWIIIIGSLCIVTIHSFVPHFHNFVKGGHWVGWRAADKIFVVIVCVSMQPKEEKKELEAELKIISYIKRHLRETIKAKMTLITRIKA